MQADPAYERFDAITRCQRSAADFYLQTAMRGEVVAMRTDVLAAQGRL